MRNRLIGNYYPWLYECSVPRFFDKGVYYGITCN
nr:MAG TPA: hypothetical protein [Caudoviricetes sp.]